MVKTKEAPKIAGLEVKKAEALVEPSSIMIYGRAKTGKSTLAASVSEVPGYERVLHIDLEKGSVAFANRYPNVDVVQVPFRDIDTFNEIIEELHEGDLGNQYDAVIVDTMSTLQEWAIWALGNGQSKLEFDQWRMLRDWTMETMWQLHYMKPLGITSYHLTDKEIKLTKELWTLPLITGSAQYSVANVPDIVARLYIVDDRRNGPQRVADLMPREDKVGGNRFDYLPEEPLTDISMPLLWEYIRHERTDVEEAPKTKAQQYVGDESDQD